MAYHLQQSPTTQIQRVGFPLTENELDLFEDITKIS